MLKPELSLKANDKQYKEVDKIVSILSRYEYVFNDELERYVDQLINEEPVEGSKTKASELKSNYSIRFKRLNCVEKSVLDALKLYEGRDLFLLT